PRLLRLRGAAAEAQDVLLDKEKMKAELDTAKRELAQAQSKELTVRQGASKTEASLKEAVQSRLDLQQELEKLKAVSSSEASERKTLEAQIASLEAQLKNVKSEDGAAQALRQQVTKLEEELAQLRAKHLQAASDQAAKISASEAKALDAERTRITLEQQISSTTAELSSVSKRLKEAQLAESELLMTKTRLADAETQLSRAHQEMAKREGDVATQRAAAQASALELAARDRLLQQLRDDLAGHEELIKRLKQENLELEAQRSEISRLKRELANLQGETASEGETLRSEVRNLLAEVKEKEQMQIKVAELTAQLSQGRSSQALLETSTADAKEQLRGVRAELTEQRALAAEDARRLRSELWEERSAAASAAVVAAGELAALRSSRGGDAVAEIPSASSGREADEALRQQVSVLEAELRRARAEQATASATVSAERQQLRQLQVEEDLALRQAREEARQAREKLTSSEANISAPCCEFRTVFEEWQRRLVAEVEAERSEGDQRAQRLRQELRRLEQDSDEASARQRVEMRRKDQQLAELEKELRQSQRLLAAKEAELSDVQHLHEARLRREETTLTTRSRESAEWEAQLKVKMNHLDEREALLRSAEQMLRQKETELEGQTEPLLRGTWPAARSASPASPRGKASTTPAAPAQGDGDSPDTTAKEVAQLAQLEGEPQATTMDGEIEEMLAASIVTLKPEVWPGKTQQPDAPQEGHEDEKGLLELVQKKRRQLKKQRAALMVEMEHWRSDVTSGRRPKAEKNVLEQRLATVLEGLRETKAVERTLLSLHWPQKDVDAGRHYNFVPATREAYGHTSPREEAAMRLLERWRSERRRRTHGALSARSGSSSTIPFISRAMPYSARASRRKPVSKRRRREAEGIRGEPESRPTESQQYQEVSLEVAQIIEESIDSELVSTPTAACLFTLEMSSITMHQHEKMYISAESPCVMVKWDHAESPFWLSCLGHQKKAKDKPSMLLEWTRTRSSRDALRLEVVKDRFGLNDFDTVVYHRMELRKNMIPRISSPTMSMEKWIHELQKAERAFSEMIFFLAHSLNWQYGAEETKKRSDALKEAWSVNPQRQRFVRELKYIDETVKYFRALSSTMPEMSDDEVDFQTRQKGRSTITGGNFSGPTRGQSSSQVDEAKARVLKVLVRLWLYCFLRNRSNENFFYTRGYMDIIDAMNGRGLGASDVFVALLSQNRELVRKVKPETVTRFLRFIRVLGPLDTWLLFLKALCNPQNDGAISDKQQLVLSKIAFAGLDPCDQEPDQDDQGSSSSTSDLVDALLQDTEQGATSSKRIIKLAAVAAKRMKRLGAHGFFVFEELF
ncbi:unnamed protein product, partial [Durusdinium trenchii]